MVTLSNPAAMPAAVKSMSFQQKVPCRNPDSWRISTPNNNTGMLRYQRILSFDRFADQRMPMSMVYAMDHSPAGKENTIQAGSMWEWGRVRERRSISQDSSPSPRNQSKKRGSTGRKSRYRMLPVNTTTRDNKTCNIRDVDPDRIEGCDLIPTI